MHYYDQRFGDALPTLVAKASGVSAQADQLGPQFRDNALSILDQSNSLDTRQSLYASLISAFLSLKSDPQTYNYLIGVVNDAGLPMSDTIIAANAQTVSVDLSKVQEMNLPGVAVDPFTLAGIDLTADLFENDLGRHDLYTWGGTHYWFADALNALKKNYTPRNKLEESYIALFCGSKGLGPDLFYKARGYRIRQFKPSAGAGVQDTIGALFSSLEMETDYGRFLALLLQHEAYGLSLVKNGDFLTGKTTTEITLGIVYNYNPVDSGVTRPRAIDEWLKQTAKDNRFYNDNGAFDLDLPSIAADRKFVYGNYKDEYLQYFISEVCRFQEICLAQALSITHDALDVAKMQDLSTLTRLLNYFANKYIDILYKISGMTVTVNVVDKENRPLMARDYSFHDDVFEGAQIPLTSPQGVTKLYSVGAALLAQAEACMWLVQWNMLKYSSVINELSDPTAHLMSEAPVPYQFDPWQNPFLLPDLAESQKQGKSLYVKVSSAPAQLDDNTYVQTLTDDSGATNQYVTSNRVRVIDIQAAPAVFKQLRRTLPTLTGFKSPQDVSGKAGNFTGILFAAAAAAGALYLSMK
jgi:hypothetical protein